MDEKVSEIKPPVSTASGQKGNATAIKPAETAQLQEKGVINKAMDYEAAMTSPTELLAPEVFPDDITDMNGNAVSEKRNSKVDFHQGRSSICNVRRLLFVLLFFIVATLVMAALFAWKMVETSDSEEVKRSSLPKNPVNKSN